MSNNLDPLDRMVGLSPKSTKHERRTGQLSNFEPLWLGVGAPSMFKNLSDASSTQGRRSEQSTVRVQCVSVYTHPYPKGIYMLRTIDQTPLHEIFDQFCDGTLGDIVVDQ